MIHFCMLTVDRDPDQAPDFKAAVERQVREAFVARHGFEPGEPTWRFEPAHEEHDGPDSYLVPDLWLVTVEGEQP